MPARKAATTTAKKTATRDAELLQEEGVQDEHVEPDELAKANAKRAAFSVKRDVPNQPKYLVTIAETDDPNANELVPIMNGDFSVWLKRGRTVVMPECIVSVLRNAKGQSAKSKVNPDGTLTIVWTPFTSYPHQAVPYNGPHPIGAEVDEMGERVRQPVAA